MTTHPNALAQQRFHLATELLALARRLLGADHGVTILVHTPNPASQQTIAMQTTLPSRRDVRLVLCEVLFQSLLADGATPDNVVSLAMRELAEELEPEGP